MREINVRSGNHELFKTRLLAQLAVDMIDTRAGFNATMQRWERCEAVALVRRRRICDLLQPVLGEGPTPNRRFVVPIDDGVARLRSHKAMVAIQGVLIAIQ
jgi:hypothetical protein